ncbi:unnamed protein product [Lactuca virosa]|uniref:Ubiquitin-like protease family profile domain-containing protein n=1 Tax=Lactuca virosa TaxID=75947 RepID=A0AAU9LJQ7_9ASTR|nr:unnamed protein product [Lactuca virosa]
MSSMMNKTGRSRKKSERILLKTTFSKFTNEESNPVLIDMEDEDHQGNETEQPRIKRQMQKKDSTSKKKIKKQTGWDKSVNRTPDNSIQRENEMRTKKRFDSCKRNGLEVVALNSDSSWNESVDPTPENAIQRENELRTKKRFDSCKRKGHEVVVLNSRSKEHNLKSKVKVNKFDVDVDSDFEYAQTVVIRKNRMHGTSFKNENEEHVKKLSKNVVVQKRRKNNKGNVGKARKVPKVVDTNAKEPRRIQVRTSPNVLYNCMHNLSEEQESYISSIGLGHLLNMKVDGYASIIGHYTVRNFDANRMVLRLHHRDIPINREVIHELLSLPLGNVAIKSMAYRHVTDDTITAWRKQFDDEDNIRPRAVQQAITQTTRANLLFKVNIFVLLCNTLGQSMSMGRYDLSMLSKVTKDLDLSDIDWYGYVFDCLKDTKSAWNPYSRKGFYVGPIIFLLLLYVESVRCDSVKIVRGRPKICFWNVDKLRERERVECRTIGLGMGELQEPFQVINESVGTGNVVHEKVQTNDAGEGVKLSHGCFKGNEGKENFSGSGETVEATLSTIKEMHDMLMHQKKVLEDKINDSVKKYLDNPLVQEWKNNLNDLFKEVATSDEPVQSQWWYDNEDEIKHSLILAISHKQFDNLPIANYNIQMSKDYADSVNGSRRKSSHSTSPAKIEIAMPLSIVPFMNEQKGFNRRGDMPRMKSGYLKYPYIIRDVDITKGIPRPEKRVADWIFSLQGKPTDIVFHSLDGFSVQRFHMESFLPTCELFGHVIDCWSPVLNLDESKRAPESPLRVYCKMELKNSYLEGKLSESQCKAKFLENLLLSIEDMDSTLRYVGLLFLPVVRSFHIILFVINLQHPEFVIIDNSNVDDPIDVIYGQFP